MKDLPKIPKKGDTSGLASAMSDHPSSKIIGATPVDPTPPGSSSFVPPPPPPSPVVPDALQVQQMMLSFQAQNTMVQGLMKTLAELSASLAAKSSEPKEPDQVEEEEGEVVQEEATVNLEDDEDEEEDESETQGSLLDSFSSGKVCM